MEYSSKIGKELKTGWECSEGQMMHGDSNVWSTAQKTGWECSEGQRCMVTAMCGVQLKDRKRAKNRMGM